MKKHCEHIWYDTFHYGVPYKWCGRCGELRPVSEPQTLGSTEVCVDDCVAKESRDGH